MMLKETYGLPDDLCVYLVSEIGDACDSRILHERVAEELGDPLAEKDDENCNREQRPDTMNLVRKKGVQINRLVGKGVSDQQESVVGSARIEHPVKDRRDHERDESFGKPNHREAHNSRHQPHLVRLDVSQ